eukprot:XP_008178775.1 PREDICTED: uncharacterized protein K02A2.6-like [Acyrthosiphon pisum]
MSPNGDLQAPSYVELYKTVAELQKKIKQLETETTSARDGSQGPPGTSVVNTQRADVFEYRVLPDLDKSIKVFDGCEPVHEVDDWIQTVEEKARLCRGLPLSFDETRDYIIQGIYHKELAMYVLGKNHADEEGLMSDLFDWTRMNAKRTEIKHEKEQKGRPTAKVSTKGSSGSGSHASGSTGKWVTKTPKPEVNDKSSTDTDEMAETDKSKCWVCRKVGLWSIDCTMKKNSKCFACGAEGHFTRDCTSRPTVNNVMMMKETTNPYLRRGKVNGIEMTVLLDTGSYYTLLKSNMASRYLDEVTYKKEEGKLVLCKPKDDIGLGDVSVVTTDNELDILQVLTAVPGHRRRDLRTEDFKYVNTDVSIEEQTELLSLINEYRDCFALGIEELGCTTMTMMDINETEGRASVTGRPYKTTAADRETIAEIIGEWKRHGVVVETDSPYASPVILVKQGDKNRLCVDYRKLNKQIIRHNFPLPDLQEQVESLRAGRYSTQLDLASGYLQVPLSEAAQEKTAFITPDDTGPFTRMPFGLAGAPGEFTRLMRKVLGSLKDKIVKNYLYDWVVDAEDWLDMLVKLRMVLDKLRIANLTLKPYKCLFGAKSIEFLGFVIGRGQISPGTMKSQAIEKFLVPKDVHGVRRFLGVTGFFRRFVQNYATLADLPNLTLVRWWS